MEEPSVTVKPGDQAEAAIRALRTDRAPAAFVVAPDHRLVGHVTEEEAAEAFDSGHDRVRDVMNTDFAVTRADTPLAELLTPAARSEVPLAVVDQQGRLTGVIPRGTLLAALGDQPETVVAGHGPQPRTAAGGSLAGVPLQSGPGAAAPGAASRGKEAGGA
jgi:glycine betaine/proline transport system ATP-binding protein